MGMLNQAAVMSHVGQMLPLSMPTLRPASPESRRLRGLTSIGNDRKRNVRICIVTLSKTHQRKIDCNSTD